MDERQRLDDYLAWRRAQRIDRRARLYRLARVAGTITALILFTTALAFAVVGWPRAAKRDVARLPVAPGRITQAAPAQSLSTRETRSAPMPPAPASAPAEPRVTPRRSVPPAARRAPSEATSPSPSASMSSAAAEPETPRNAPPEVLVAPPPPAAAAPEAARSVPSPVVVVQPPAAPTVMVAPPATVVVERPAQRAAAPSPAPAVTPPQSPAAAPEERMDMVKRLTGYIPEVWLARTVARWVRAQPAGETGPPPPERELPQAR